MSCADLNSVSSKRTTPPSSRATVADIRTVDSTGGASVGTSGAAAPADHDHAFALTAGTTAARPAASGAGRLYLETDVDGGRLVRDDGAAWQAAALGATPTTVIPPTDGAGDVGTPTRRYGAVRAVLIIAGDLGFDDDACPNCLRPFSVGEDLVLRVVRIETSEGVRVTRTVPRHARCRRLKR